MQTKGEFAQLERSLKKVTDQIRNLDQIQASLDVTLNVRNLAPQLATMALTIGGMGAVASAVGKLDHGALTSGLSQIDAVASQLVTVAQALGQVQQQVPELGSLAPKLLTMGVAIVSMGAVTIAASYFSGAMVGGLIIVERLSEQLLQLAVVMEQIDRRVPNLGQLAPKLVTMGVAISGMGAVTLAADYFSRAMIDGLVIVEALTNQLMELAIALEQIDQTVPDFGQIAPKLVVMGIAIVGMGAVTVAADYFSNTMIDGLIIVEKLTNQLLELAIAIEQIDQTVPDFGQIAPKLAVMGIAIGGMGIVTAAAGYFSKGMLAGLEIVESLIEQLLLTADALAKINQKVPDDLGSVIGKLGTMGLVLTAMGLFVATVGLIAKTGIGAAVLVLGSIVTDGLASTMINAADAIDQIIQKVPDDLSKVGRKVEVIAGALRMVASNSLTAGISLLGSFVGMFRTAVLVQVLRLYGEAAKILQDIQNIKLEKSAIEASINQIAEVLVFIGSNDALDALEDLGNLDASSSENATAAFESFSAIADAISQIQEIEIDASAIGSQMDKIKDAIGHLSGFDNVNRRTRNAARRAAEAMGSFRAIAESVEAIQAVDIDPTHIERQIGKLRDTFAHLAGIDDMMGDATIDTATVAQARQAMESFAAIAEAIEAIQKVQIDPTHIENQIRELQKTFNHLKNTDVIVETGGINTRSIKRAKEAMEGFAAIAEAIDTIQEVDIRPAHIESQIRELQKTFNHLKNVDAIIEEGCIDTYMVQKARDAMESFASIAEAIDTIQKVDIRSELIERQIDRLREVITHLKTVDQKLGRITIDYTRIQRAATAMTHFQTIAEAVDAIQQVKIQPQLINEQIDKLREVAQYLNNKNDVLKEINIKYTHVETAAKAMSHFRTIAEAIKAIQEIEFNPTDIKARIANAIQVINKINDVNFRLVVDSDILSDTIARINQLKELSESISALHEVTIEQETIISMIADASLVIGAIRDFITGATDIGDMDPIQESIDQFKAMLISLSGLSGEFSSVGVSFASELLTGFDGVEAPNRILDKVNQLLRNLIDKVRDFRDIGRDYGQKLKDAFTDAVESLSTIIRDELTILESFVGRFTILGTTFGSNMVDAFKTELGRISGIVGRQITNLQAQLNGLSAPSSVVRRFATGGLVPAIDGRASIFAPMGTDTVPAMLTPGEFVQKKSAVGLFGLDFMRRVNNGDISGAFRAMTSRFNMPFTTTSSVSNAVQNINHTTNNANRITMNTQSVNPDHVMKRISRYF